MSMKVLQDSNNVEDLIPTNTNIILSNECHPCHRIKNNGGMKSLEVVDRLAALTAEEIQLKSLHRRLEMRIKRLLRGTHNSILMQEKLLNIEKRSKDELLMRKNTLVPQTTTKDYENLLNNVTNIETKNKNLEKNIDLLHEKIRKTESNAEKIGKLPINHHDRRKINNQTKSVQLENQLHRINLELSERCARNSAIRVEIQRMLAKRREMIIEYNRLLQSMQNANDESRRLTSECSESFANRRTLVARMQNIRDQYSHDERKVLDEIRELDRLLQNNNSSKNFLLKKYNVRQEQIEMNEVFSGNSPKGTKSTYTADEFRRLFRIGFDQDFSKEKVLNRTVERLIDEQEQVFTLFEYAVDLVNEVDDLHEDLDSKRQHISNILSDDTINSFVTNDIFAMVECSANNTNMNVQSLEIAKQNLHEVLNQAYQLIHNLFVDLGCDQNIVSSSDEVINDRNILIYLATIESNVEQLLSDAKHSRKSAVYNSYVDDTTISWQMDHANLTQASHIGVLSS